MTTRLERRTFLWAAVATLLHGPLARAADPVRGLLVRVARPPQLETPGEALDEFITPLDQFFVRSHFEAPAASLVPRSLAIVTSSGATLDFDPASLRGMGLVERTAVLQCSGNGRGLFKARVPGIQWGRGAVGNARWRGVPLGALLERMGHKGTGGHLHVSGHDTPPHPQTPRFDRSIPVDVALAAGALVALEMNDVAVPELHGGPYRLVVPGWAGNHWLKWLARIEVAPQERTGFFMDTGYRMALATDPTKTEPLTTMPVKSWITSPGLVEARVGESLEVAGHALSGDAPVTMVEISTDGGASFVKAAVDAPKEAGTWQRFRWTWTPAKPGPCELVARATDAKGRVQPAETAPNKSGYLWNGWDRRTCEVKA